MSTISTTENAVLATSNQDSNRWASVSKPKIVEFYGFEGEDFRHFLHLLESFFAMNGITQDSRKVAILHAQLRRVAAVFFDNLLKERNITLSKIAYQEAIVALQEHFISESIIECYQSAFEEMHQVQQESPSEFLSRLYEAADLANITDEKFIYSRFRAGLANSIKIFCKEQSAISFQDWIKHSNAWWNAHSLKTISLVDNPFNYARTGHFNGNNGKNLNPIRVKSENTVIAKGVEVNNSKSANEAYVDAMSPTIASITARMEALELHSLIPHTDDNGQIDMNAIRNNTVKSLLSDNEFKSLIKNIIQETNNERVYARKPYRSNRRNYYENDEFNNYPDQDQGQNYNVRPKYQPRYNKNNDYNMNSKYPQQSNYYQNNNGYQGYNNRDQLNYQHNNYGPARPMNDGGPPPQDNQIRQNSNINPNTSGQGQGDNRGFPQSGYNSKRNNYIKDNNVSKN